MTRALKAGLLVAAGVGAYLFFLATEQQHDRLRHLFPH